MREIKFRGLNTKGEWVYGSLVNTTHGISHKPHNRTKTWIIESAFGNGGWFNVTKKQYVNPETVGQFTGSQDNNDIDTYEGDIARCIATKKTLGCIVFISDSFEIMKNIGEGKPPYFRDMSSYAFEVVGNIHQNPELLEESNNG